MSFLKKFKQLWRDAVASCFKPVRVTDKKYLQSYRDASCLVADDVFHECSGDVVPHHSLDCPFKGMAVKGSDDHTMPACQSFHNEIHSNGNEKAVLKSYGITHCILEWGENRYKDWLNDKRK